MTFFLKMAHISMPVLVAGLFTCAMLEITGKFGYGAKLGDKVRTVLEEYDAELAAKRSREDNAVLVTQGIVALLLVIALGFHLAEPGVVGLMVIVMATGVCRNYRGTPDRSCLRRGAAVYGPAGRIFCRRCRH